MAGNDNGFAQGGAAGVAASGEISGKGFAHENAGGSPAAPDNGFARESTLARLSDARERLSRREEAYALEPEAAGDYETLPCGMRLHKPAIPHAWAMAKAAQAGGLDTYSTNLVTAYILAHTAEEVRNSLMPRLIPARLPEVVAEAEEAMMAAGAPPAEVLEAIVRLTREAFPKKRGAPEP